MAEKLLAIDAPCRLSIGKVLLPAPHSREALLVMIRTPEGSFGVPLLSNADAETVINQIRHTAQLLWGAQN